MDKHYQMGRLADQLTGREVIDNVWELLSEEQRVKAFGWTGYPFSEEEE